MVGPPFIARHLAMATILSLAFSACTVTETVQDTLVSWL